MPRNDVALTRAQSVDILPCCYATRQMLRSMVDECYERAITPAASHYRADIFRRYSHVAICRAMPPLPMAVM